MATKSTNAQSILIPTMELKQLDLRIIGVTPLLVHEFGVKAKREMLDAQMGKAKAKKKDPKNPIEDFIHSIYWLAGKPTEFTEEAFYAALDNGARFGFPATAFKAAAAAAGYRTGITKNMVSMLGAFHVNGESYPSGDLVEIIGQPEMHEAPVRIGMGKSDIRHRGIFHKWEATLHLEYNTGVLTVEQLVNLINLGGFVCGIGEWRVDRGGEFGRYKVATES